MFMGWNINVGENWGGMQSWKYNPNSQRNKGMGNEEAHVIFL